MAIFERLGDLIRSNINDLIDRAENPEKMFNFLILSKNPIYFFLLTYNFPPQ